MAQFKNAYDSHNHSLEVLDLLYGYDSFLDSLSFIADMGCGEGLDAAWWASLYTRDDPPEPRNYTVYAVDNDQSYLDSEIIKNTPNIIPLLGDFEVYGTVPRKVDLIWAHDSLQYAVNPYSCISSWRRSMNINGMLVIAVPQDTYYYNNRLVITNHSANPYSYNILNLIYMLACNGFDCNDAYFYRKNNTPWLYAAVYATEFDPETPKLSWYELVERNLVNSSIAASVNKYGFARLDDLVVNWLDKSLYKIDN